MQKGGEYDKYIYMVGEVEHARKRERENSDGPFFSHQGRMATTEPLPAFFFLFSLWRACPKGVRADFEAPKYFSDAAGGAAGAGARDLFGLVGPPAALPASW